MTRRLRRGLLLVLLTMVLGACAGVTGIPTAALRVSLADFHVESLGDFDQELRLVLRIRNPNDIDVEVRSIAADFDVGGRPLARSVSEQPRVFGRNAESIVAIERVTYTSSVLIQVRGLSLGRQEKISYRLHGRLNLVSGGSVPFEELGEIPVKSLVGERQRDRH